MDLKARKPGVQSVCWCILSLYARTSRFYLPFCKCPRAFTPVRAPLEILAVTPVGKFKTGDAPAARLRLLPSAPSEGGRDLCGLGRWSLGGSGDVVSKVPH